MRVVYDGKGYDLASAMYRSSNASWAKLIAQTKRGPFKVAQGFAELAKLKQKKDAGADDVLAELAELDEGVIVRSLTDLVFLARVEAGEAVTWEQVSAEVPFFAAWGVMAAEAAESDKDDDDDAVDPTTARTDSGRATADGSGSTVRSTISSDTSPST